MLACFPTKEKEEESNAHVIINTGGGGGEKGEFDWRGKSKPLQSTFVWKLNACANLQQFLEVGNWQQHPGNRRRGGKREKVGGKGIFSSQ